MTVLCYYTASRKVVSFLTSGKQDVFHGEWRCRRNREKQLERDLTNVRFHCQLVWEWTEERWNSFCLCYGEIRESVSRKPSKFFPSLPAPFISNAHCDWLVLLLMTKKLQVRTFLLLQLYIKLPSSLPDLSSSVFSLLSNSPCWLFPHRT